MSGLYFPPSYFPPSYFAPSYAGGLANDPGAGNPNPNPSGGANCFAGYGLPYSAAWCWGTTSGTAPTYGTPTPRTRDCEGLSALGQLLDATSEFASVVVGRQPRSLPVAGQVPRVWLRQTSFAEKSLGDPESRQRTVGFALDLVVNSVGDEELERLADLVADTITGQDLGFALPELTEVATGRYFDVAGPSKAGSSWNTAAAASYPEAGLTLLGQFVYLIDGFSGRQFGP